MPLGAAEQTNILFLQSQYLTSLFPADRVPPFMSQHPALDAVPAPLLSLAHPDTPHLPAPISSQHLCHLLGLFSFMLLPSTVV